MLEPTKNKEVSIPPSTTSTSTAPTKLQQGLAIAGLIVVMLLIGLGALFTLLFSSRMGL